VTPFTKPGGFPSLIALTTHNANDDVDNGQPRTAAWNRPGAGEMEILPINHGLNPDFKRAGNSG
jgi:hypothetical protein